MPNIKEQEKPARKLLPIIYVLDTSGSMIGARIASVNRAMSETMDVLKAISDKNPTAELKIGVCRFATGAEWIMANGLVFMEDFYWTDLKAGGLTDYGKALEALHDKLSRKEFLDSEVGYKLPVIIFMSDGGPTDDYENALENINTNNKWFRNSTKIAIAIGDDADVEVLGRVTGSQKSVIRVDDQEALMDLIKVVSVSSAMIGSQSRTTMNLANEIINDVQSKMGDDVEIQSTGDDDASDNNNASGSSNASGNTGASGNNDYSDDEEWSSSDDTDWDDKWN